MCLCVFFSGHSLWGRKTHKQNPPPKIRGQSREICVYVFSSLSKGLLMEVSKTVVRVFRGNVIPLPPLYLNLTSFLPWFTSFLPLLNLNLTSASSRISNHGLETTVYRLLVYVCFFLETPDKLRKTREGWNCRFQKTPRTEGGDKVPAVWTQGSRQVCLSRCPKS